MKNSVTFCRKITKVRCVTKRTRLKLTKPSEPINLIEEEYEKEIHNADLSRLTPEQVKRIEDIHRYEISIGYKPDCPLNVRLKIHSTCAYPEFAIKYYDDLVKFHKEYVANTKPQVPKYHYARLYTDMLKVSSENNDYDTPNNNIEYIFNN